MRVPGLLLAILLTAVSAFIPTTAVSQGQLHVRLDVAALDAGGAFNLTLKQSDFSLYDDGIAQKITEFHPPDTGSNILMLFDHNDTWTASVYPSDPRTPWNRVQTGIFNFMNSLQPQDRIAIAAFEDRVTTVLPWRERSGPSVTVSLRDITAQPTAGKNLYGALEWAASQFRNAKGRLAVIVFTDGRDARLAPRWFQAEDDREVLDPLAGLMDTGEQTEFENTLKIVRDSGIQVYFIAPYPDRSAQFAGPSGRDYHLNGISGDSTLASDYLKRVRSRMEQVALASGGKIFFFDEPDDASKLLTQLSGTLVLAKSYHIAYVPTLRPGSAGVHRIDVRIRSGEFQPVQSRTGYYER